MSPSYNHSVLQANLIGVLKNLKKYSIACELSLEINGIEYRPDICIYPKRPLSIPRDIIKMTEMPLLSIEIISITQTIDDILNKFEAYFGAGIKSCWLVIPFPFAVMVFSSIDKVKTYSDHEIIDENLNIRIQSQELFD
ncbi:MAG: Uma2 family endonuclease [Desulfobacterales bacterium]|nr:Uma2 family endonuclease [Desulfobacterales bacterium]